MSVSIARKNLFEGRIKFVMSVGGVSMAILLILVLDGVFAGALKQVSAYMDNGSFNIVVSQKGVKNLHMTTSFFPSLKISEIKKVNGVGQVSSILYSSDYLVKGSNRSVAYIIGYRPGNLGGPWTMARGTTHIKRGQIIIDKRIADKYDLKIGDNITTLGRSFKISGLTKDTVNIINSIAFIRFDDFEKARNIQGVVSYALVTVKKGQRIQTVAKRIRQKVKEVTVLAKDRFSASEKKATSDMSIDIIRLMNSVAFLIGLAALGLSVYTVTLSKLRDYGILKAIGSKNRKLMGIVFEQAIISVAIGFVISIILAFLLAFGLQLAKSNILIVIGIQSVFKVLIAASIISIIAASIPILRVARVDPQEVFRR